MRMDPDCITKPHLCPREEVAAPHVILGDEFGSWEVFLREGMREEWLCCGSGRSFIIAPRSSVALWVSIRDVDRRSDVAICAWLAENWEKRFIVTFPVYRNEEGGAYTYSYYMPKYIVHLPTSAIGAEMIRVRSFTMCNGLTLAIAMHRLGKWSGAVFRSALQMFVTTNQRLVPSMPFWTWMTFDEDWSDLDTLHQLPVMHFPDHYALCGGAADCVIEYLCGFGKLYSSAAVVGFDGRSKYQNYLSTASCAPEKLSMRVFRHLSVSWPQRSTLHTGGDMSEPDWMGFARIITSRRGFWRLWRQDAPFRERVLSRLRFACNNESCLYNLVFPALMVLYREQGAPHARVSQLWRDCIRFYDPTKESVRRWLRAYAIRIRVTDAMAASFPADVIRHAVPPVGFFRDVCRGLVGEAFGRFVHQDGEYRFMVRPHTSHVNYLQAAGMTLTPINLGQGPNTGYMVTSTFYETLEALGTSHSGARIFLERHVQAPVITRLLCIKHAFREKKGLHLVEDLLLDHFRRHREELYSIA